MKKILSLLILVFCLYSFESLDRIKHKDFNILIGQKWSGSLTYLDYTSNKKNRIPSDLYVSQSKDDYRVWYFKKEYPKEPHANNIDTLVISNDGSMINNKQ